MSNDRTNPPATSSARDVLRNMWESRRAEAAADLSSLLSTLQTLASSPHEVDIRSRAQVLAHQLVGVFGVFGFTDLKNRMARIDISLSDPSADITDLLNRVKEIADSLP